MADNRKKLARRERELQNRQQAPSGTTNAMYIAATQYQFNQASLVPMAEELARLEEISPGLADRAFSMAEKQQTHRHKLETIAVEGGTKRASRGQIFAFVIAVGAIGGGVYLSAIGQP